MTVVGWHVSHEQISPSVPLAAAQRAEEAGFDAAMSSDHFSPWSERQGRSAFGAFVAGPALQSRSLRFGVVKTAAWCADWAECARWADGLVATIAPRERLRWTGSVFRDAGRRGALHLQGHRSWAPDETEAEAIPGRCRSNVFPPPVCGDLDSAELFDAVPEQVPMEPVRRRNISADLGRHAARLAHYAELGLHQIYLDHVGQQQDGFIDAFGAKVLPQLQGTSGGSAA